MDTSNPLNTTDNTQDSKNPQQAPAPGASNAKDFQSTAPSDTLRTPAEQSLTVEKTGDPAEGGTPAPTADAFPLGWVIGIGIIVAVGVVVLYTLLKESMAQSTVPATTGSAASKPKVTSKPAKKTTAKKKSNPNQRRKKSAKKRK